MTDILVGLSLEDEPDEHTQLISREGKARECASAENSQTGKLTPEVELREVKRGKTASRLRKTERRSRKCAFFPYRFERRPRRRSGGLTGGEPSQSSPNASAAVRP